MNIEAFIKSVNVESCIQCATINGIGGILQGVLFGPFSPLTILILAGFGGVVFAPVAGVYYPQLDDIADQVSEMEQTKELFKMAGLQVNLIVLKLVLDQTLGSIMWNILFTIWASILSCSPPSVFGLLGSAISITMSGWIWWIPVQVLNFTTIPKDQSAVFLSLAAIPWNMYLASKMADERSKTITVHVKVQ